MFAVANTRNEAGLDGLRLRLPLFTYAKLYLWGDGVEQKQETKKFEESALFNPFF